MAWMYILVDSCTSLQHALARGIRQTAVRQAHRKHEPDFHDKNGNLVLIGGAVFFTTVWGYVSALFSALCCGCICKLGSD